VKVRNVIEVRFARVSLCIKSDINVRIGPTGGGLEAPATEGERQTERILENLHVGCLHSL
jgi:hypothetical protein